MNASNPLIKRLDKRFQPNPHRVVANFFESSEEGIHRIYQHVSEISEEKIHKLEEKIKSDFGWRHRNIQDLFNRYYAKIKDVLPDDADLSDSRKNVLASYFTMEYSVEAAALFNPSIVMHPDQRGVKEGQIRFILSLRATGEGHISSLEFMSGVLDRKGNVQLDETRRFATLPTEINTSDDAVTEISFDPESELSERVLFPVTEDESNGIEDVRFVRFEDGTYYGTFTAYDGNQIKSKLLQTSDFLNFKNYVMKGEAIKDKGMALFPKKIDGQYAMISRQDDVNIRIMFSDDVLTWKNSQVIVRPASYWEFRKIGNCGSPLETDEGWLLLTHGVGPMRKYEIGACLLDKKDPTRLIGRLKNALISPDEQEREGYVPNVVYTCGALRFENHLLVPYAMSDSISGFGLADINAVIAQME